jgi:organic hydroperoxide reductase OsmC/OhrA
MRPLPHLYTVTSLAAPSQHIRLNSHGLNELVSEPPTEFGGPGDLWSPETLLMAAIADCFTLTFRAAAKITNLPWTRLECAADGTVDRIEGVTRFTAVHLRVSRMDGRRVETLHVVEGYPRIDEESEDAGSHQVPERHTNKADWPTVWRHPCCRALQSAGTESLKTDEHERYDFKRAETRSDSHYRCRGSAEIERVARTVPSVLTICSGIGGACR